MSEELLDLRQLVSSREDDVFSRNKIALKSCVCTDEAPADLQVWWFY